MDDQEIKDRISGLRKQGNLREAYQLAVKARKDGISVEWALSWVLYSYLKREKKDAGQQGNFNNFVKVLTQMGHFGLFDMTTRNYYFWKSVQTVIISEAWELAKDGQLDNLYNLYRICVVLQPLFDIEINNLEDDKFYVSKKHGDKDQRSLDEREGMWGFVYDLFSPLLFQVYNLDPLAKLTKLIPLIKAVNRPNNTIEELIWDRIIGCIASDEYQLQHGNQKGELWRYWKESNNFLVTVPAHRLRSIIAPYYYAFYNKNDLSSSVNQLIKILPVYGFSGWSNNDYQHQPMKEGKGHFPSFVNRIMLAYIKSLMYTTVSADTIKIINDGIAALETHDDDSEYYNWIIYNYGKLLFKNQQFKELIQLKPRIINIIKQNSKVSLFWSLLAKCYHNIDHNIEIGLLEMALSCPNAMQYDASQLIQLFGSQPDEGTQLIISGLIQRFPKLKEKATAPISDIPENLDELLQERAKDKVGQVLFNNCQKEFYVEWNNIKKNSTGIFFSKNDASPTKIHDSKFAAKVQEGKCYSAIIVRGEYYGRLKECKNSELLDSFRKDVQERLNIPLNSDYQHKESYGFLEPSSTFVNPEIIDKYQLKHYDLVSGSIVSRWHNNKKKGISEFENELKQVTAVSHASLEERYCTVRGRLKFSESRNGNTFVFLVRDDLGNDVLVPHFLISDKFSGDQEVTAKLKRSWNRKNDCWSWKAVDLIDAV